MAKPDKQKASKGGKKKLKVNFKDSELRTRIDDDNYHCKVAEVTEEEGNEYNYLKWTFEIVEEGKYLGRKVYTNTSLSPAALWNLRQLLETLGVETPDDEMELDLEAYAGLELICRVENEVYQGKDRPKVTDYIPLEETADVDDDEKSDDDDEEEEDEEEESEDEEEESEDEEDEEEEDEEDEEESEDEGGMTEAEVAELDDDELADLVKKNKLKVDLASTKKKSKRVAMVVEAMKKAKLLN